MNDKSKLKRRSALKSMMVASLAPVFIAKKSLATEQNEVIPANIINRLSHPSKLKITDMRVAVVKDAPMNCPIIRIDTNQGIYGLGEVRDGADERLALFLKSRILGENPCNVERLFKKIKQFGNHGRMGGGVSGVEMALWDLAGKAYGVPVYQMLGGKYRDKIRIYCDTEFSKNPKECIEHLKARIAKNITFLKIDLETDLVRGIPNTRTKRPLMNLEESLLTPHPLTGIELTPKGIEIVTDYVAEIREAIGYEIPLAADHFGHIGVNSCIRLGQALEPYQLSWMEDLTPWNHTDLWKSITDSINVPTITGEDIYLLNNFKKLIDTHAVDMVHPDLATAGGILETKKIGDYAEENGVAMAMHFAGTPVSCMANVHCAAATQNFIALEHHSFDVPWWDDLVTGISKPIVQDGFIPVPEKPGLGIDLDDDVIKQHLGDSGFFRPTPDWSEQKSWDRWWS